LTFVQHLKLYGKWSMCACVDKIEVSYPTIIGVLKNLEAEDAVCLGAGWFWLSGDTQLNDFLTCGSAYMTYRH